MSSLPAKRDRFLRQLLYCGMVVLAALGAFSAIMRSTSVAVGGWTREQIRLIAPAYLVHEAVDIDRWFANHPRLSLLHVILGGFFLVLASLQFSPTLRSRHIQLHRWLGRTLVFAALPIGFSGLVLGAVFPFGGPAAASAIFVFGTLFLIAVVLGFVAIRNGDIESHREWMIRMFSIAIGISSIRVVGTIFLAITRGSFQDLAGPSFWTGLVLTFGIGELWIRHTRQRRLAVRSTQFSVPADGNLTP